MNVNLGTDAGRWCLEINIPERWRIVHRVHALRYHKLSRPENSVPNWRVLKSRDTDHMLANG